MGRHLYTQGDCTVQTAVVATLSLWVFVEEIKKDMLCPHSFPASFVQASQNIVLSVVGMQLCSMF